MHMHVNMHNIIVTCIIIHCHSHFDTENTHTAEAAHIALDNFRLSSVSQSSHVRLSDGVGAAQQQR